MNLPIVIRTLVQQLRDKATYIYFLIFPLLLMVILGSVLQGAFGVEIADRVEKINVQYVIKDQETGAQFEALQQELDIENIDFKNGKSESSAIKALKEQEADAYFTIGDKITVHTDNLSDIQFTLLKSYLVEIFQSMRLMQGAAQFDVSPQDIMLQPSELDQVVKEDRTNLKKPATSYQYYAVAMIGLFILYMAENGLDMFGKGRRMKTLQRELISPVSRQQIVHSTFLGHVLLGLLVVGVQMLITQVVFDVPWQQQFGFSFINLSSLMVLFLVIGVFLETIGQGVGMGITQVIIQVAAFLGGGYFPVDERMMAFSPLGWVMGPIREALWTSNPLRWHGVILNLVIAAVLYLGTMLALTRREEF